MRSLSDTSFIKAEALLPRQEFTGPERTWAERYSACDVLRYARRSKETGIEKGEYARVKEIGARNNLLTYNPSRQQGVSLYREEPRSLSVGDRIQFTVLANDMKVANRELATIESIDQDGRLSLKMDHGGREVQLDPCPVSASRSRLCGHE